MAITATRSWRQGAFRTLVVAAAAVLLLTAAPPNSASAHGTVIDPAYYICSDVNFTGQ